MKHLILESHKDYKRGCSRDQLSRTQVTSPTVPAASRQRLRPHAVGANGEDRGYAAETVDKKLEMKVTMMLADAAQSVGGKLYILGGGWSVIGPGPQQLAIALKLEVPWNRANDVLRMRIGLFDEDGNPAENPDGSPVRIEGDVEVGRPPGLRHGTPLDVPIAINVGVALEPEARYEWRLELDGVSNDQWQCAFSTRSPSPVAKS